MPVYRKARAGSVGTNTGFHPSLSRCAGGKVQEHLLIFSRFPVPGEVKTRLIPALGPDRAALLQRRMTEHVVSVARSLGEAGTHSGLATTLFCTGAPLRAFRAWLGPGCGYQKQGRGTLGERMERGVAWALRQEAEKVLILGTDIPDISVAILRQALASLADKDLVLGPAMDGGYYLLGLKRMHSELFHAICWGSSRVYDQTMRVAGRLGLSVTSLPPLHDVDGGADLDVVRRKAEFADCITGREKISVILPTLNEEQVLARTLARLQPAENVEMIVADGGSDDATTTVASQAGAVVVHESGGRAAQLNRGVAAAQGRILLFLHADTLVPNGYAHLIRRALAEPSTVAGAFRFRTDAPAGTALRFLERAVNWRAALLRLPYGDQGLFMERRIFAEMGGFVPLPVMEDFELVLRLRRRGRLVLLPQEAVTSARRWQRLGLFRTTLINQLMIAGFLLGISPKRLQRLYRRQ